MEWFGKQVGTICGDECKRYLQQMVFKSLGDMRCCKSENGSQCDSAADYQSKSTGRIGKRESLTAYDDRQNELE